MPCIPIENGVLCVGGPTIEVEHNGRTYRFERHAWCGLLPVTKNGDERVAPVPGAVWDMAAAKLKEMKR